jgi:hypothetical protein
VRDGKVSVEAARHLYGVIFDQNGLLDEKATSLLRESRREKRFPPVLSPVGMDARDLI